MHAFGASDVSSCGAVVNLLWMMQSHAIHHDRSVLLSMRTSVGLRIKHRETIQRQSRPEMVRQQLEDTSGKVLAELQLKRLPASSSACVVFCECVMLRERLCSLELAQAAGQQERNTVAELQVELVGFKDCIRVAEGELAKNAPLIAQLNHANQNMGNRVSLCV